MGSPEPTQGCASGLLATPDATVEARSLRTGAPAALLRAGISSTLHRIRRGEGALLAVNLSLIAFYGGNLSGDLAEAVVSGLAILLMYAFNDLYDAPVDLNNPKKDRGLVATYLEHRRACGIAMLMLKLATVALAFAFLGTRAAIAVTGVMLVNVSYSMLWKGMPVADVIWCGIWGALYAAIVSASPSLLLLVGLMTAVCHVYQTLDDRPSDAANGIMTTAVRSSVLSRNVLIALSVLLFLALREPLGGWALTAFTPLVLFFATARPSTGWLLSKAYFAAVWLSLLGAGAPYAAG
jgi:4-hydroxybenzoate polyprenyltransferase